MDSEFPVRIGWQGLTHHLPVGWEVAGLYGSWRTGQMLVAEGREPRLSISWERKRMRPDLERTLAKTARKHLADFGATAIAPSEACGVDGIVVRMVGGEKTAALAARRLDPAGITMVWRQLTPGSIPLLKRIAQATTGVADDEPATWAMHGLSIDLPPFWRSEGLQVLAGLVRGVWFHYPGGRQRVAQALIMRRYACAEMLLEGRDLETWLRAQLFKGETAEVVASSSTSATIRSDARGKTLWRRLRGIRETRQLSAVWNQTDDRLLVQETTGSGELLAPLRSEAVSPRCGLSRAQEATSMP
jgi:hypothetical protein